MKFKVGDIVKVKDGAFKPFDSEKKFRQIFVITGISDSFYPIEGGDWAWLESEVDLSIEHLIREVLSER